MHIHDILRSMRSGNVQSDASIGAFVRGVVDGTVSRPQAAAWLAYAFQRGLTAGETLALTQAMTQSGTTLAWGDGAPVIDKHSTGGVGDKVSLVLAPLWAELGFRVPMISGRGLGHTGGTLDKLEAIPGFQVDLPNERFQSVLDDVGCFMAGQTATLAPADRVLYALRNETQTVDSIPLIVGSILSKKLAEGISKLVLDVKVGSKAFMTDLESARVLATTLVSVASSAGVDCSAHVTAMDRPLGRTIGHSLEVEEAIACLKGGGPDDLRVLTLHLADHADAADALDSGRAFERFVRLVEAQGGQASSLDGGLAGGGCAERVVLAPHEGVIQRLEPRGLAMAVFALGGGRSRADDALDLGVGIRLHVTLGDEVEADQPLMTLYHRDGRGLDLALQRVHDALQIGETPVALSALILESHHA
jgi:pyrimidine-nucleoside phosphorylase